MKTLQHIVVISALSLVMAGSALAQTTAAISNMPESWKEVVQDKFFETGKLRNEGDLKSAWASMTAEQQAMVRSDCQKMGPDLAKGSEMEKACAFAHAM